MNEMNQNYSDLADNTAVDPSLAVYPDDNVIDPDFSVFPDYVPDRPFPPLGPGPVIPVPPLGPGPVLPVPPLGPGPVIPVPPLGPGPVIPCPGCSFPSPSRSIFVRFLCASPDFSNLSIDVGNRTIVTGMNLADVSRYLPYSRGFQRITVTAPNGYVFLQQNLFLGNNCTVALVSSGNRLRLMIINDPGCASASNASCLRVCNLAYYSGSINLSLSNGRLRFTNVRPGETGSFNRLRSGSYSVSVARTSRPFVNLLSTYINLDRSRVYTLYVINWNPSTDTIQVLLTEDLR